MPSNASVRSVTTTSVLASLGIMTLFLLSAPSAVMAYDPAEVCKVDMILTYYLCDLNQDAIADAGEVCPDDTTYTVAEPALTFTLTGGALGGNADNLAIINEVGVKSELQLQPGKFTISINGYLCSNAATLAYEGTKNTLTTIDGTEGETTAIEEITIIAIDKETYTQENGQNVDFNPIITSVSVTNAIGRYGVVTTFDFEAVDPGAVDDAGNTAVVVDYTLTSNTLQAGNFGGSTQVCTAADANSLETCQLTYTPSTPDAGNMDFKLVVKDDNNLEDEINGYLAVDAAGTMTLGLSTYHTPQLGAISVVDADQSSSTCGNVVVCDGAANPYTVGADTDEIAFGKLGLVTIPVTDIDIAGGSNDLADTTTMSVTAVVLKTLVETPVGTGIVQDNSDITCDAADIDFDYLVAASGDVRTITAVWNPWNGITGKSAADFGELWCQFSFKATDSLSLESQVVTFTLSAYGTKQTGGESTGGMPFFSVMFVSDNTPAATEVITLSVAYEDPDSSTKLYIAPPVDDVWATIGWTDASNAAVTSGEEVADCTGAGGCTRIITLTVGAGQSGAHTLDLILTDQDDTSLTDVRSITFNVGSRRHRRAGDGNHVKSSPIAIAITGTTMLVGDAFNVVDGDGSKTTVSVFDFSDDAGAGGDGAAGTAPVAVIALVGAAVLAVALVGVLVRTRQLVQRTGDVEVSPGKVEAGEQQFEYNEAPTGEALTLQAADDAATLGHVTEI